MNKVVEFLNANPVQYLATVGRDGKAKCRPFMFAGELDCGRSGRSARSRPSRSGDRERALTGRTCTKPEHALFVMLRFFDILKKAVFIPKCSFFPFPPGDVRHDSAANRYPYSHWQCRDLF